jgi:xylulokinase
MTDVVVGLDIGTSSSKAVAVDAGGTIVASVVAEHSIDLPRPGWVEQDAERVWWEESCTLLRRLAAALATAGCEVQGLGVSGIGPCVLPCDSNDRPLRPAILYGIDTRADAEIAWLNAELGVEEILTRSGSALTSQAAGAKVLWLRRNEPDVWDRTAHLHSSASFLVARLTGEYVFDHHTASQFGPLYELDEGRWNEDWGSVVTDDVPLPRLVWADEITGRLTAVAAAETGLPAGLPVVGGTVDAWAEAHSVGVRAGGQLLLMYGSTMFLVAPTGPGVPHPGLWRTAGLTAGSQTLAAGMATSGLLTRWVSDLTARPVEELSTAALLVPPGADGLVLLPYFAGERSPLFDPGARGVALGLALSHGAAHLMRAVYEATAMSVRHVLETFAEAADDLAGGWQITAAGGGAASSAWTQIVSDVTGEAQVLPEVTIGASYGDALLAAAAVGLVAPDTDWTRPASVVEPDEELAPVYARIYETYRELYPATRPLVRRLEPQAV